MHKPGSGSPEQISPGNILFFSYAFQIPFLAPHTRFLALQADGGWKQECGHFNSAAL